MCAYGNSEPEWNMPIHQRYAGSFRFMFIQTRIGFLARFVYTFCKNIFGSAEFVCVCAF